jgi:RimK family alpha-L-glutamate ligase
MARKLREIWRKRILLLGERNDDHSRRLTFALRQHGARVFRRSLRALGIDTTQSFGLDLGGFEGLPDGVFVRSIPAGTFEQVTLRLGLLHALRELGAPVWNDARAIEACIDKSMTSHLLAKAGIATPATFTAQSPERAIPLAERELAAGHRLVCKPLFGAQGRGLRLIEKIEDLPVPEEAGGVFYLQHFVATGAAARDFRVFVCAGAPVAGMTRVAREGAWITNVKQGGQPQTLLVSEEIGALAARAAAVVGADYAGVDLIRSAEGVLQVLEVNSMPAWSGLQSVTPALDISAIIAAAFMQAVRARQASTSQAHRA